MKQLLQRLIIVLITLSLIGENLAVPAIRPQSQRGIIFPTVDQYDDCFVDEQQLVRGTCRKLADCPAAVERWKDQNIRPQTCYFNKFDHIVCCENENVIPCTPTPIIATPAMKVQRRSESECELFYGPKIAVVHGEPTAPKEFPFMAALGWRSNADDFNLYRCGGALISDKFVLTAAHCVEFGGDAPQFVRLGGVNLTDSTVEDITIKRIIIHPGYNITSPYNDIALIELTQAATEGPVCIWSEQNVEHNNVTALGYGSTHFAGISSDQLLKAALFVVPNNVCAGFYSINANLLQNGIATTHICAGDPDHLRDTCQGDSGGPIIMKVERFDTLVTYVVGITSLGEGCAGEPPSIYTRTSSYIDWIESIVWPMNQIDIRRNKKKK